MSVFQKIAEVEAEMARTQKNKATNFHLGLLKAKLSKLRAQLIESSGSKGGGGGEGFDVSKTGDARVGLVGFPSVGKSTLLNKLTGTYSEVAAYEFTTLTCVPGVFKYKGSKIQLLDLPGIIEGAKDGKGRGKQVIAVARTCSLILVVLDAAKSMNHKRLLEKEMEGFGIRLNKSPPNITFTRKDKGGITVSHTVPLTNVDEDMIKSICHEYRISNASFAIRCDATVDDIIDVIEGNRIYIPCLYVLNKIDQITIPELDILSQVPHYVPISAHHEWNLDLLLETIWKYLDLVRIYTKPRGKIPDYEAPVILKRNHSKVEDFCLKIHKSLLAQFKYALVWGTSVKHNPQKVGKEHVLADQDIVQIVKQ
ncbi:developmentally regulated GTP-binding [Babesia ovis]|uniref:Developmentally regulated GTP-binding n=1 Tax=Babesia ovis TaxID=5869 RepID=A0A9W5TAA4_BABOV|nr:developmentally regulated GTP-binding [Babesia ovis]